MLLLKVLSGWKDNLNLNFVDQSSSLGLGKVIFYMQNEIYQKKTIFFTAFSLIMFAYAGSASFPTYQADMKNKEDFPKAVLFAMISEGTST